MIKSKKASLLHQTLIHVILIAVIFALFFMAASYRANSRLVKQQVLEKELALMIDVAVPDTTIIVSKIYMNGKVDDLKVEEGKIFAYIDNQELSKGYPYTSRFDVSVEKDEENYFIIIK